MISKERIINGCEELFLKAGIKAVTMDDIAKHLGISKKTIYQHYAEKGALVYAWVENSVATSKQAISQKNIQTCFFLENLISMEKFIYEIFSRTNPIVIHDLQKYHSEAWLLFHQFKFGFLVRLLENILITGIADGFIGSEINSKIIATMRVRQYELVFDQNLYPATEFDLWEVQSQLFESLILGIGTIKVLKQMNELKLNK
jgi:AcrR family transcriptional regulator